MQDINNKLLIFGAGGHASKVLSLANENGIIVDGFISTETPGTEVNGIKVLGDIEFFLKKNELHSHKINIAIGENSIRYNIYSKINNYKNNLFTVISSKSYLGGNLKVAAGSSIMPFAIINEYAEIGESCIIDSGSIVEHHVKIGNFVNVSPGAVICGGAIIEDGAIIGASATVIEKVKVGKNSLIGAGSVVVNDIPDNSVAIGNPAKVTRSRNFNDRYLK
jgi:acetyltransferase EpsM